MGIYSDLITEHIGVDTPALGRVSRHQLEQVPLDPQVDAAYAAQSEVSRIAQHSGSPSSGNYTLTVEVPRLGIAYTTASIAHNATDATIETALDAASPAGVGDGDIAVTQQNAAGLSDGYCDFTCSGNLASTSVIVTASNVDLNQGDVGAATRTTPGQTNRKAAQALWALRAVAGDLHNSGEPVNTLSRPASVGQSRPRAGLIEDLAQIAASEDGSDSILVAVRSLYPTN